MAKVAISLSKISKFLPEASMDANTLGPNIGFSETVLQNNTSLLNDLRFNSDAVHYI